MDKSVMSLFDGSTGSQFRQVSRRKLWRVSSLISLGLSLKMPHSFRKLSIQ